MNREQYRRYRSNLDWAAGLPQRQNCAVLCPCRPARNSSWRHAPLHRWQILPSWCDNFMFRARPLEPRVHPR